MPTNWQGMSCEGACAHAHAHVRCAVARVRVHAKSILKIVRDVRACGSFFGMRCVTILLHTFGTKLPENGILEQFLIKTKNIFFWPFWCKKCAKVSSHTRKRAARTHIAHTFQKGFRTHTHTCDRTSHVCVCARTFATHALPIILKYTFDLRSLLREVSQSAVLHRCYMARRLDPCFSRASRRFFVFCKY